MTEPGPLVVVIAGPNGAGKSTWAPTVVRDGFGIRDFVNADEIAKGLSAFNSAGVALQAGRLCLAPVGGDGGRTRGRSRSCRRT